MGKTVKIRVDEDLPKELEILRRNVASELKQRYNLNEITVHGTLASKILAAKMHNTNFMDFKINKNGLNRGTFKFI